MTINARQRHMLEVADRTRDVEVITAVIDTVLVEGVAPFEVEQAFRDAAAQTYLIAGEDADTPLTVVLGMREMLDVLADQELTPDQNRAALKALRD